jgi:GNAT superfamily N-acetyltransferase
MTSVRQPHAPPITRVESDAEIAATWDVMRQLRPHLAEEAYLPMVRRMMESDGYRLASASDADRVVRAVAGFRTMEMLYCGRILYVDDLVSDGESRSQGYGAALLDWLRGEARALGCEQLHLDSGVQRQRAHRFYFREGMAISAYHFVVPL